MFPMPGLNRRAFLKSAVCAGAALHLSTKRGVAAGGMFVSLNSSLTGKVGWPEFARLAARLGYGGADVNLAAARKEGLDATRALFQELRIRAGVVSLPVRFSGDDAVFEEDLGQLGDNAAFAAAIDCPRMMTVLPPSSTTPKAEFRKILKDRMTRISDVLNRSQVRLGLEFLGPKYFHTRQPYEFIWRMDEALEFSRECGANIGLTLDAWHWHHAGATASDIRAAGKSRIVHVHVSDAKRQPPDDVRDNQRFMPGEGIIDLTTFFQTLRKIGYEDGVSPEPIGRVPPDMSPDEAARLALQTTLDVMRKAGLTGR
jgi:sugar phosphate isomerase/epimerase